MAFKIKRRCIRCLTVLREGGTCGNEKCSRYVPDKPKEEPTQKASTEETTLPPTDGEDHT